MEPDPDNPFEVGGVLNPGVARGPDGCLYLFPRMVGPKNFSRIGIAQVHFDSAGDPAGVRREGVALVPQADYEFSSGGGGCEDPRVTYVEPLGRYVMAYTALTRHGPRIALATSADLFHWQRLGLAWFQPHDDLNFNDVPDKDGLLFGVPVPNPKGELCLAMIHRPLHPGTMSHETIRHPSPRSVDLHRESMWISYSPPLDAVRCNHALLCHFASHHRLASPVSAWERLKIGGGAPPLGTSHGFLVVYHGVADAGADVIHNTYSAGVLILDEHDPRVIVYRSPQPVLTPQTPEEVIGPTPRVIFPTGTDRRVDIGQPDRIDIYYGMADYRIGAARIDLIGELAPSAKADPHEGRV